MLSELISIKTGKTRKVRIIRTCPKGWSCLDKWIPLYLSRSQWRLNDALSIAREVVGEIKTVPDSMLGYQHKKRRDSAADRDELDAAIDGFNWEKF